MVFLDSSRLLKRNLYNYQFLKHKIILFITEICLRNCANINSVGFQKLAKLRNLERLDLYRTNIETLQLIEILKHNKNLKHLNLGETSFFTIFIIRYVNSTEMVIIYFKALVLMYQI